MKRNLVLIIGIALAILTMMLMGNVITIAEKLGEVCHTVYVEYAFYALILILAVIFIIRPIIKVHAAPEFPVLAVDEQAQTKQLLTFGKRLVSSCGYIADEDKRKEHQMLLKRDLQLYSADHQQLKGVLDRELALRFDGDKELDVLGINTRIKEWGKTVFMVTAISQNGIFDSAAVMVMNYKLIEDLVLASGFRPTRQQMFKLYVRVLTTSLISYCTSQVFTDMDGVAPFDFASDTAGTTDADMTDINPEDIAGTSPEVDGEDSLTGMLSRFKIPGVVAESALQGAVNALLTLRIGYVTKAYLMEGPEALAGVRNKRAVKRQAIKSAFKALPGIIGSSATSLGKGLTGFVARMASKGEKQ
jgi:hypothetical protein